MRSVRRAWRRMVGVITGARADDDLSAEMSSHLQLHIDEQVRRGVAPEEARRVARLRLGGVEQVKDAYRDQRGLPGIAALWQDVRYTGRLVRRSPGFYAALVLILACTLGFCGTIVSVVRAILLKPLPYGEAHRLVSVQETSPNGTPFTASAANAFSWRDAGGVFEDLALFRGRTFELTGGDVPERIPSAIVSANLFDVLRTRPLLGRTFLPGEDDAGRSQVLLISHGLWTRRFGARPEIVGQFVQVDGRPHLVAGVLREDFEFPAPRDASGEPIEIIAPIDWTPIAKASRDNHAWRVVARLKGETSLAHAREAMQALGAQLAQTYETNRRWGVIVDPLRETILGKTSRVLVMLLIGVAALLLVGCANIANLLLARGIARRREFVVRAALGASVRRLGRQMLTESVIVAGIGAAFGLALAHVGVRLFVALAPRDLPRLDRIASPAANLGANAGANVLANAVSIDAVSVIVTAAIAVATALLFGAAPAWYAGHTQAAEALRASGRGAIGAIGARLQQGLVAGQIALTVVLLIGAGLLVRSAVLLQQAPVGFETRDLITARIVLDEERYPGPGGRWQFLEGLLDRLASLPGVERVAAVSHAPLVGGDSALGFYVEGQPIPAPGYRPGALRYSVSPAYFRTMGVPLLAGRAFMARDRAEAPAVAIVNDFLVRRHLAGRDPIGARLRIADLGASVEIVGVVGDTKHYGLDGPVQEQVYLPYAQYRSSTTRLLVRTALAPDAIVPAIRRLVAEQDPRQPISNVATMEEAIGAKLARPRLSATLLAMFAALALLLAGAGVFALFSYLVGQRTGEMGLRLALGAQRAQVLATVFGGGLRLAALGLAAGLTIAWACARWLQSLLFGIAPHDPLTFVTVAIVVMSAALLACINPARRAARVDPATALRAE